jgi:RHS repeat-associated protein
VPKFFQFIYLNLPAALSKPLGDGGTMKVTNRYDDQAQRIYKASEEDGSIAYYIRGLDGQTMAEYDDSAVLKCWHIGSFGFKTKDGGNTTSYYYLKDHLGNIRVTFNDEGTIVTKDDYYTFGLQMPGMSYNAGNANDRLKYSSKELDEGMGMPKYHFGWRDYDPEIGRWHVKDPLYWLTPGQATYNYCSNDPVNKIDIFGLYGGIGGTDYDWTKDANYVCPPIEATA